jgi:two-component system response regulator protein BraR/BceR
MYRILIVEDDLTIAKIIKDTLCKWDFEAEIVSDFRNVVEEVIKFDPHLVLLDVFLPFFNGYHWCGEIRKFSKVPVIFISSAGDGMNIVMAVNMGGDDFIVKPFDLNVLIAKVRALIRRTYAFHEKQNVLEYRGGGFEFE